MHLPRLHLWDKRTLYLGPVYRPEPGTVQLCHAAATLVVALDCDSTLRSGDALTLKCQKRPGSGRHPISCDYAGGDVACCFLDVFGCDFALLTTQMQKTHDMGILSQFFTGEGGHCPVP